MMAPHGRHSSGHWEWKQGWMPKRTIYFIYNPLFDGYSAYLCEENRWLIHSVPRILFVADLLVHVIDDLEVFGLLMLIQRLHVCRFRLALLKQVLGLGQRTSLCTSSYLQACPLGVFFHGCLWQRLLSLPHGLFPPLGRYSSAGGDTWTLGEGSTTCHRTHQGLCFSCHILYLFSRLRNS